MSQVQIAIFASGSGTNAENIIKYFENHPTIKVNRVYTNKASAGVIARAKALDTGVEVFDREAFKNPDSLCRQIKNAGIDYIILAGFLWLMPKHFVQAFDRKILNIHPALLPAFGGKGMYGDAVHKAVLANGEWKSGITIHLVNEVYDAGAVLFQKQLLVCSNDTPDSLASRIHSLEYQYFPEVIETYILSRI